MALTTTEQALYDWARNALPKLLFAAARPEEILNAYVKIFDAARGELATQKLRSYIKDATGIWLDLHGSDHGILRREGESDASYSARIANTEDAVTRPFLISAAQEIIDADLVGGSVAMVEVRRDGIYLGSYTARTGTGGEFTGTPPDMEFTPDVDFPLPLEVGFARSGAQGNPRITFSGSLSAGNDGTFEITGLNGAAVQLSNGSGVAEVDAGTSWTVERYDVDDNVRDGFSRAYLSRGYRLGGTGHPMIIYILPYNSTAAHQAAVLDMSRQKDAGGVHAIVEYRQSP